MGKFNQNERTVLCVILIGAGALLAITSGGFMLLANALDGLHGMGNPSRESLERARQDSLVRNLVLLAFILSGGGLIFLGLWICPSKSDRKGGPSSR